MDLERAVMVSASPNRTAMETMNSIYNEVMGINGFKAAETFLHGICIKGVSVFFIQNDDKTVVILIFLRQIVCYSYWIMNKKCYNETV